MRTRPHIPDDQLPKADFDPLPDAVYDFQVESATEKTSEKGNNMIELVLKIWAPDGGTRKVWDYLIDSDSMEWRTRHFAKATGLIEVYDTGNFSGADCVNVTGKVKISTQKARTVNGKNYKPRNVVDDYVAQDEPSPAATPKPSFTAKEADVKIKGPQLAASTVADEDIPF